MKVFKILIPLIVLFLFILVTSDLHAQENSKELNKIKKQLEQEKKNLEKLRSKKVSILDLLEDLDQKIHRTKAKRNQLQREVKGLKNKIKKTETQIRKKKIEINRKRTQVNSRMVSLYKMGKLGSVKVLFSSTSFSDLVIRSHQLNLIIKKDLDLIEKFSAELSRLKSLKSDLDIEKKSLDTANQKVKKNYEQLFSDQSQKKEVVTAISGEEEIHKRYIQELEKAKKDLEALMNSLVAQKKAAEKGRTKISDRGFSARKGTLKPPVRGKIQKKFGKYKDPDFFTYQFHKGLDITAKTGDSIKSVFGGRVVYSGWFKGFGQIMIIDHGGGYHTLSANTQDLYKGVGDEVLEGEKIGSLGAGSEVTARNDPHLYFEVREHGKSVDPLLWLAKSDFL